MESNEPVPALAVETTDPDLKTAAIVAVTPEQKEVRLAEAIETAPPATEATTTAPVTEAATAAPVADTKELPKTASLMPLIALLGLASLGIAFALKRIAT